MYDASIYSNSTRLPFNGNMLYSMGTHDQYRFSPVDGTTIEPGADSSFIEKDLQAEGQSPQLVGFSGQNSLFFHGRPFLSPYSFETSGSAVTSFHTAPFNRVRDGHTLIQAHSQSPLTGSAMISDSPLGHAIDDKSRVSETGQDYRDTCMWTPPDVATP